MKKIFCVLLCLGLIFCFIGCKELGDQGSGEFRILELTEKKIPDFKVVTIVDANDNVVLDNADIEKVLVVFEKSKDRYLELRLNDEGTKKFKKALKQKDVVLSLTLNQEKIASPVVADDAEENSAIILGEYEDVMLWFNSIT